MPRTAFLPSGDTPHTELLLWQLRAAGLPLPDTEVRFHPVRRWRVDALWPRQRVALEIEGGYAVGGRHTSVKGFLGDMTKYNELAIRGYRLVRVTPRMVENGQALTVVERALKGEKA